MSIKSLNIFDKFTVRWFERTLGSPTAVQEAAWPAIAAGVPTLVSAPTGTGKTLSAFLVFIDQLKRQAREGTLKQELQVIYVSPLKALAGDIRENLRRPLNGILEEEYKENPKSKSTPFDLNIAIRTGDTPQKDRKSMIKTPPHILITTPESLYLMITSKSGQAMLKTAKAIIIDELHALIDSKRGAHLMLSIARLDQLCENPLQRIGLSATIEPLIKAAEYLSPEEVTIVAPKMHKEVKLVVTSPISNPNSLHKDPIWQELSRTVYLCCEGARSVIAFVDGRMYAEKLAYYVNQVAGEGFARTHHGCLSKEQRFEVEEALRAGELRLLCATSSMELGIDVGDIDQVFQIGCPRSISSTMQRLGRAGHNPNRVSVMHIFPRAAAEGLYCGLTTEVVRRGGIEYSQPPRLCFDVLAQHLVSMATGEGYHLDEVMEILPRAYPFREVTREDVRDVLCMLAGDYEHERDLPVRPRILYDRIHDQVVGDPYSRMLAVSAGGTIPDKGLFTVKTENGVKLGELDEEFIFESRVGDKFLLGTFAWKIVGIQRDAVIVTQANVSSARLPFWKSEIIGRRLQTGIAFGVMLRKLANAVETDNVYQELRDLGLDDAAAHGAKDFLKRQMEATGILPDEKTIIIEHFKDKTGIHQMMVHSVFGRRVNAPMAILAQEAAKCQLNTNISCIEDDDGFLLYPYGGERMPEELLFQLKPDTAKEILTALLPTSPLFNITFRYNAARALMMGVRKKGRQPLWVQRLRGAEMLDSLLRHDKHPLIRETKRECLEDHWDLQGVEFVLNGIQSGAIQVREMFLDSPSPMSLPLRMQTEATMMYDYAPTPMGIHIASQEALKKVKMLPPTPEQLARISQRARLPENENQLHSLLMIEGDLVAGEVDVPIEWLEALAQKSQAQYIEPGLWIAAEHMERYSAALVEEKLEARMHIVRRLLRYRGAHSIEQIAERYFWTDDIVKDILQALCQQESILESGGIYYHAELYQRAQHETIKNRRRQINTLPPERYAALISNRSRINASTKEQLEIALKKLSEQSYPIELWEGVLLPARVKGYRPDLLDALLSQGNLFWKINSEKGISFHHYDDIDWESDLSVIGDTLEGNEKIIYQALQQRGASFMQRLSNLLSGVSPHDTLLDLAEKGLICADSFVPIRQLLNRDKLAKGTAKQKVNARVMALTAGRWEISRPLLERTVEQQLERIFDRVIILCRETSQGISWARALETLRMWEYTGRVRRGYFIEGLSGVQFIRDKDFAGVMQELAQPRDEILWLSAVDPAQPWGKSLPHLQGRSFLNVPNTAVALRAGIPVAVMERQGKVFRVFEETNLQEILRCFAQEYLKRRLFPTLKRITVKQYPPESAEVLISVGFTKEILDYVLYQGIS